MDNNTQVWQTREPNLAKLYLMEYRALIKRHDALIDEIDRMRDASMRATSRLSATRLSGTGSHGGMEDSVLRVVDCEAELNSIVEHIDECLLCRVAVIEQLVDERQKLVLTYRYINGDSWDQIIKIMHYAERQVFRIYGEALEGVAHVIKGIKTRL